VTAAAVFVRRAFSALEVRNFRLYFTGQVISVSGTWMQRVAQSWLVLELTGSGSAVGTVTAFQFLPLLLLAPVGGLLADRMDKRKVLFVTQTLFGLVAAVLAVLVLTERVELWMVFALALVHGLVGSFDNPARTALVAELVGTGRITNALGLHSVLISTARVVGPAVGGFLIVTVGMGICFVIGSASYLALIAALVLMRSEDIERAIPEPRRRRQLRDGLRYVRSEPVLFVPLVMMAVIGLFVWEFEVVLPLLARFTFAGDADLFGTMFAALGVGSVAGGLYAASMSDPPARFLVRLTYALGAAVGVAAITPWLWAEYLVLVIVGATVTAFLTVGNSVLQIHSLPEMRGRVVALRAVAVLGARPIGAPIGGWIGEHLGPRYALGIGAVAGIAVAVWAHRWIVRYDRRTAGTPTA
jgi:MFS family permease